MSDQEIRTKLDKLGKDIDQLAADTQALSEAELNELLDKEQKDVRD